MNKAGFDSIPEFPESESVGPRQWGEEILVSLVPEKFMMKKQISLIIHCAAQPSHDYGKDHPVIDFNVNATGTLNLLEAFRIYCPNASFIFTSTNKVYGDTPNFLPLKEKKLRYEIKKDHKYFAKGIDENMSIDHTTHSLFGASKTSADLYDQLTYFHRYP